MIRINCRLCKQMVGTNFKDPVLTKYKKPRARRIEHLPVILEINILPLYYALFSFFFNLRAIGNLYNRPSPHSPRYPFLPFAHFYVRPKEGYFPLVPLVISPKAKGQIATKKKGRRVGAKRAQVVGDKSLLYIFFYPFFFVFIAYLRLN